MDLSLPGVWGVSHTHLHPLPSRERNAYMEVQQDAAGVWGVPRFFLLSPQEWGIKGVDGRQCARMVEALWEGPVSLIQQACSNGQQIEVDNQPNNP